MTERPELDAWLAETDRVLDQDTYGHSWEASAMHVRASEAVEAPARDPWWRWLVDDVVDVEPAPRFAAPYFVPSAGVCAPPAFSSGPVTMFFYDSETGERTELGTAEAVQFTWDNRDVLAAYEGPPNVAVVGRGQSLAVQFVEALSELVEDLVEWVNGAWPMIREAAESIEELQQTVSRPPVRMCPRHSEEMRAGQCRYCQREQIRQMSRRRR